MSKQSCSWSQQLQQEIVWSKWENDCSSTEMLWWALCSWFSYISWWKRNFGKKLTSEKKSTKSKSHTRSAWSRISDTNQFVSLVQNGEYDVSWPTWWPFLSWTHFFFPQITDFLVSQRLFQPISPDLWLTKDSRVFEDFQELSVLSPRFSLMIQFDVDDFVSPSLLLRPSLSKLSFNEYTSKKYPNWSLAWGIFSSSWCSRMMTLWLLIQAKSCSASRTLQGILRLQVKYYSYLQRRDSGHQSDTHEIDWIDWTD